MHLVVQHRILDPDTFFSHSPREVGENAPPGIHGRVFCPSRDRTVAVCLWEADSIDALRGYLDPLTRGASENTYFEVDGGIAIGLSEDATATA